MRVTFIMPEPNFLGALIKPLQALGHEILVNRCHPNVDVIICWSISVLREGKMWRERLPHIPFIFYNWDMYHWIHEHPRGYDWKGCADLMKRSTEVWVPSDEVRMRQVEYFDVQTPTRTIKSFARLFDSPVPIEDKRFLINHMRGQPDKLMGKFEQACTELGIPYLSMEHGLGEREFQEKLATCTATVCPFYEASTGGLTAIEAHNLGKPVILSDSPYQGGKEYLGDRAIYFKSDDYEDFKRVLKETYDNPPKLNLDDCRAFCAQYTPDIMARDIDNALKEVLRQ
jgi:hypothetical protein